MPTIEEVKTATAGGDDNRPWVTGLKGVNPNNPVVQRLDIDDLWKNHKNTFNLFIQALDSMKKDKASNPMSYYQIAGIHGCPKALWNGVEGKDLEITTESGYCAHGILQFPTWHRPYLVMLEQALYVKMLEIANSYNEPFKSDYFKAVESFRLPYWDYFRPRGGETQFPGVISHGTTAFPYDFGLPRVLSDNDLMVFKAPDNHRDKIPNPFHIFNFVDSTITAKEWDVMDIEQKGRKKPMLHRQYTVRHPDPNDGSKERLDSLNKTLNSFRMDVNRIALMMMNDDVYKSYKDFATEEVEPNPRFKPIMKPIPGMPRVEYASGSLETLHNLYHVLLGNGGHMNRVPVAAFDPVFWLHHCNIDRIFAIWQAVHDGNPESWYNGLKDKDGNLEELKPLFPFRKVHGDHPTDFYRSAESKTCDGFGYSYPDLVGTGSKAYEEFRRRYEWSVPLNKTLDPVEVPEDMKPLDFSKSEFCVDYKEPAPEPLVIQDAVLTKRVAIMKNIEPAPEQPTEEEFSYEWFIDDEVQRMALNGAFGIYFFINDKDNEPLDVETNFMLTPTIAGAHYIFAAPTDLCDNCGRQEEQATLVGSASSITSMLLDYKNVQSDALPSLTPEHVVPFLQKRLRWRVYDANLVQIPTRYMSNEKSMVISVSLKKARLPRGSGDITYERFPEVIRNIINQASATPTVS